MKAGRPGPVPALDHMLGAVRQEKAGQPCHGKPPDPDRRSRTARLFPIERKINDSDPIDFRSELLGGYENLSAIDFAKEIYFNGDTVFYGPDFGGTPFRIIDAPEGFGGPYVGGDLNYIKQGLMFAAQGMSPFEMRYTISIWNQTPGGTYSHTAIRNHLADFGYELWMSRP